MREENSQIVAYKEKESVTYKYDLRVVHCVSVQISDLVLSPHIC